MDLTVAIVTYNRPDRLASVLESIENQEENPEQLIIVDDSEDGQTREVIKEKDPEGDIEVKYIGNDGKTSFGKARNQALENTETEIISYIDDDVLLTEGWISKMKAVHYKFAQSPAIGGPAIDSDEQGNPVIEIERSAKNQNKCNRYGEVRDISGRWIPPKPVETESFRGANMSFKTDKLREIGGFDAGYRGTGFREELDVLTRLKKKGGKLIYHPELKLYHIRTQKGGTRDSTINTEYWKGRNLIYFTKKNFPENYYMSLLRLLIYTDGHPEPIWKDIVGAVIYRRPQRIHKWRGYIGEVF